MIGFISTLVTFPLLTILKYRQYSVISDLHTFQFTVTHTSLLWVTYLNTEICA
jgi:hypothetical protein